MGLCVVCRDPEAWLASLPPPGFLLHFVEHCDRTAYRQQRELALGCGLATLAVACGRKITDRQGTRVNLYVLGLAATGAGKEGPRQVAKEMLCAVNKPEWLIESFASGPSVENAICDEPDSLALLDEVGHFFKSANAKNAEAHLSAVPVSLTKIFTSSSTVFVTSTYADSKKRPRRSVANPNLSVFGCSTPERFWESQSSGNIADGSLNRWLVIRASDDLPPLRDPEHLDLPDELIAMARRWIEFVPPGSGDLVPKPLVVPEEPAATKLLREFAYECDEHARTSTAEFARGLWVRSAEKSRKLALLYAVSAAEVDGEPCITVAGARWGISFAKKATEFVLRGSSDHIADNGFDRLARRVLKMVRDSADGFMERSIILRAIRCNSKEFNEAIQFLTETGEIVVGLDARKSGGRRGQILCLPEVAERFLKQHEVGKNGESRKKEK